MKKTTKVNDIINNNKILIELLNALSFFLFINEAQ